MAAALALNLFGGAGSAAIGVTLSGRSAQPRSIVEFGVAAALWSLQPRGEGGTGHAMQQSILFWVLANGVRAASRKASAQELAERLLEPRAPIRAALLAACLHHLRRLLRNAPLGRPLRYATLACFAAFVAVELESGSKSATSTAALGDIGAEKAELAAFLEEPSLSPSKTVGSATSTPQVPAELKPATALRDKAVAMIQSYTDASDFEVLQTDAGAPVVSKKKVSGTTYPALRATLPLDTRDFPGDPRDLPGFFAEFVATICDPQLRRVYDDRFEKSVLLVDSKAAWVTWNGMRPGAAGLQHEYVICSGMQRTEDRVTFGGTSAPEDLAAELIKRANHPKSNYTRTQLHASGWDLRKVKENDGGYDLLCTYVVHTELKGIPIFVPGSIITASLINAARGNMGRVMELLRLGYRYPSVGAGALFELPAVRGRPLRAPYPFYHCFEGALKADQTSRYEVSARPSKVLDIVAPDAVVEGVAKEALAELKQLLASSTWDKQKVGKTRLATLEVAKLTLKGPKVPLIRSIATIDVPDRFGGDLRAAAFEAAAVWQNWSSARMIDTMAEQSAVLKRCPSAQLVWYQPIRTSLAKKSTYIVQAKTVSVTASDDEVVVLMAGQSLSAKDTADVMKDRKDLSSEQLERVKFQGQRIRVYRDATGKAKLDIANYFCIWGDSIPALAPKFLIVGEIVDGVPGAMDRWHDQFVKGPVKWMISSGGNSAPQPPVVKAVDTVGGCWEIDSDLAGFFKPLLR